MDVLRRVERMRCWTAVIIICAVCWALAGFAALKTVGLL